MILERIPQCVRSIINSGYENSRTWEHQLIPGGLLGRHSFFFSTHSVVFHLFLPHFWLSLSPAVSRSQKQIKYLESNSSIVGPGNNSNAVGQQHYPDVKDKSTIFSLLKRIFMARRWSTMRLSRNSFLQEGLTQHLLHALKCLTNPKGKDGNFTLNGEKAFLIL